MTGDVKRLDAAELKRQLHDGGEIALLDAREEGVFHARHLLLASCVPLEPPRIAGRRPGAAARHPRRVVRRRRRLGAARRPPHERARLHRCRGAGGRHRRLGGGRLPPLQRRARAEQGVRRGRRARGRHAVDFRARPEGADRQRRRHRDLRQPVLRGVPQQQHPDRDQRAGRGAGLPLHRHGAVARHDGDRQLRRPHPQHHRRAGAAQRRLPQQDHVAEGRHDGLAPGRVRGRARRDAAAARGVGGRTAGGYRGGGAGRRTLRHPADRQGDACGLAGRSRPAHPLCARRAHARGIPGRASRRGALGAGRAARAGDRRPHRHLERARRAGRRQRRAGDDDRLVAEADGLERRGGAGRRRIGRRLGERPACAARARARRAPRRSPASSPPPCASGWPPGAWPSSISIPAGTMPKATFRAPGSRSAAASPRIWQSCRRPRRSC